MANTGWLNPSSASSVQYTSSGTPVWQSITNVYASDGSYTNIISFGANTYTSNYLIVTGFGASIPDGSVITGIEVEVEGSSTGGTWNFERVRLVKAGVIQATDKSTGTALSHGAFVDYPFGGTSDLWGGSWSESDVENSQFGVAVSFKMPTPDTLKVVYIDNVRVRITYSAVASVNTPTFDHNSGFTRLGANNTPGVVTFTASHTDGGSLDYQIHTGPAGTGSLVGSGTCTSGTPKTHNVAYNASGLTAGTNTIYVRAKKSAESYGTASSVSVLIDTSNPSSVTAATPSNPSGTAYTLDYAAVDTYSTASNELEWEYSTSNTFSALLSSGTFTSSLTPQSTGSISDPTLSQGANNRYFRVKDGAGNYTDITVSVTRQSSYTETSNPIVVLTQTYGIGNATYREPQGVATLLSQTLGTVSHLIREHTSQTIVVVFTEGYESEPDGSAVYIELSSPEVQSIITTGIDHLYMKELSGLITILVGTSASEHYSEIDSFITVLAETYGTDGTAVLDHDGNVYVLVVTTGTDAMNIAGIEEYRVSLYQARNPYTVVLNIG